MIKKMRHCSPLSPLSLGYVSEHDLKEPITQAALVLPLPLLRTDFLSLDSPYLIVPVEACTFDFASNASTVLLLGRGSEEFEVEGDTASRRGAVVGFPCVNNWLIHQRSGFGSKHLSCKRSRRSQGDIRGL
jgi:hypothetical protein